MLTINVSQHLQENHATEAGKIIKQLVYGGVDGIITTFSIIAAGIGANLSSSQILILGLANLISDGISMSFGDYISSTSERKYILSERKKEEHEYLNNRDFEIEELVQIYTDEGMDIQDAKDLVNILSKKKEYQEIFLDHMMFKELSLLNPDTIRDNIISAIITFFSFLFFGSIPVFNMLIFHLIDYTDEVGLILITSSVSAITLFIIGVVSAIMTKQKNKIKHGLIISFNGIIATTIAYFIGYFLEKLD